MPIPAKRARGGEQRVVGVHDALRPAGRAGREGDVAHTVRIAIGGGQASDAPRAVTEAGEWRSRCGVRRQRLEPVDVAHVAHVADRVGKVAITCVGAEAGLVEHCGDGQALDHCGDLCNRMVAVRRRRRDVAVAGAG